jgi:hypothetical protein
VPAFSLPVTMGRQERSRIWALWELRDVPRRGRHREGRILVAGPVFVAFHQSWRLIEAI